MGAALAWRNERRLWRGDDSLLRAFVVLRAVGCACLNRRLAESPRSCDRACRARLRGCAIRLCANALFTRRERGCGIALRALAISPRRPLSSRRARGVAGLCVDAAGDAGIR